MGKLYFLILILCFYVKARPFRSPDFVSKWFYLEATPGQDRIDVAHYFGEVPALVQVQVWSNTKNNYGYIFPAVGLVPRDDDLPDPRAGVVYIYNKMMVAITALSENNNVRGRTIYTENSSYWEGPNNDDTYNCYVRVRAWKSSTFPVPDYHLERLEIRAACDNGQDCFYEKYHGLKEYPSMVVVRTKLIGTESKFDGFMSDAVGSGLMVYEGIGAKQNGYVTYGFDTEHFRIWTDSSAVGYVFYGADGTGLSSSFRTGELEILAWRFSTLTPTAEDTIQLGALPGGTFDQDKRVDVWSKTEDMVVYLWAEASDGTNSKFRFPGSGSLAYSHNRTAYPCSYGGLTYAYSNKTIRIWKPGKAKIGNIICIPRTFGGGLKTQGSNQANAKVHIWIPQASALGMNCSDDDYCFDSHSVCMNTTCMCEDGFYEADGLCEKDLTCSDNVPIIPSLSKRARNYVIDPNNTNDAYLDDSTLKVSWYKASSLKGAHQMPDLTSVPDQNACGSKHQVYVNGSHPLTDDIQETPVELIACYNACEIAIPVLTRICHDGSLQYRLKPLPVKDISYCFDPPELNGIRDFDPVPEVEDFNLHLNVELHFLENKLINTIRGNLTHYRPHLTFNCTADKELPKTMFYTTYWFLGPKLYIALGPSHSIENLTEQILLDRGQGLGVYLSCGVRVSGSKTGLMTGLVKSGEQFYGIKVQTPVVVLKKGDSEYITLEPTAPIGCDYSDNLNQTFFPKNCSHTFYMIHSETGDCDLSTVINVQQVKTCGSEFKAYKVNERWVSGATSKFKITTKDYNFADGYQFRLSLQLHKHHHPIWRKHKIDDIMVYVTHKEDYKYKQCYSHVDPHMQTADGYRYENQYEGEFILYRNAKYGIEVQEKTTLCNRGRAFCACAVAVRAGGDIFLINTCGGLKSIGFTSCEDGGILDVRKRTTLRYQVFTPIGTYIDIKMRPHPNYYNLMNIDVFLAPKDFNNTEGLCGYFDNNRYNDLQKRNKETIKTTNNKRNYHQDFSKEWRIQPFEQNYLVLNPEVVQTWQEEQRDMFCYCNQSLKENNVNNDPVPSEASAVCSASIYGNCHKSKRSVTEKLCEATLQRNRRSTSELARKRELDRRQQLAYKQIEIIRKREVSSQDNITEEQATKYCSDVIESQQAVKKFGHRLKSIDPLQAITECAYDVSEGNDMSWADVYPSVLNQVIEANNERDPEYVKANEAEVAQFISQSCPFDCSGNGNCSSEGECICNTGFHGPDCSIDEEDLLQIDDIEGGGLCDLNYGDECRCFHIQTINLLENFQCHISEKLVMVNGSQLIANVTEMPGEYIDIFNGECCVPGSRAKRSEDILDIFTIEYTFSISNNGKNFGKAASVYLFDSACQEQVNNKDGIYIVLKEKTCFISGICRVQNETRFGDECSVCYPQHNKFDWTEICGTSNIDAETRRTLEFVLGLCGGLAIALICVLAFCVWRHLIGKKMMTVADMTIYRTEPPKEMAHKYRRPDLSIFYKKYTESN